MHWNNLADFLAMGNHGLYVWGSVVVTVLLMIAEPILVVRGRRKLLLHLMRQYRAEGADRRQKHGRPTTHRSPA